MHPPDPLIGEEEKSALPRGIVRLLRSGLLSEERARRILELHGKAVEGFFRKSRPEA